MNSSQYTVPCTLYSFVSANKWDVSGKQFMCKITSAGAGDMEEPITGMQITVERMDIETLNMVPISRMDHVVVEDGGHNALQFSIVSFSIKPMFQQIMSRFKSYNAQQVTKIKLIRRV